MVFSAKGQTLLELTVLIGVMLAVIAGLAITTINGLKNSQLSQNQAQATKLAQEGLENLRTAKERNCPVVLSSGSYSWYGEGNLIWGTSIAAPVSVQVSLGSCSVSVQANDNVNMPSTLISRFTRIITIQDETGNTNQKKIVSSVGWTDISGTHNSNLVTILSND